VRCQARLFFKIDRMAKLAAILGGIVATLIALGFASYRAGDRAATAEERHRDYKRAQSIVQKITRPLPSSSAFRDSARATLRRRMR
jgi:hypothetical protein